jgi:hypothetical protein
MSLKIDIFSIIKDHISTLKNANDGKATGWDKLIFLLSPIGLSISLLCLKIYFSEGFVNIIVSGLSIFVGLLFNIIVILFDIVKTDKVKKEKKNLIREVVINISFCIVISLFAIITALTTQLCWGFYVQILSNFITYFLVLEFFITLLMVLKRMYFIFITELDELIK